MYGVGRRGENRRGGEELGAVGSIRSRESQLGTQAVQRREAKYGVWGRWMNSSNKAGVVEGSQVGTTHLALLPLLLEEVRQPETGTEE